MHQCRDATAYGTQQTRNCSVKVKTDPWENHGQSTVNCAVKAEKALYATSSGTGDRS